MRDKRRYILVEASSEIGADRKEFESLFYSELIHNIGETEYFRANPKIIRFIDDRRFILKCGLSKYKETIVSLSFIKRIGKNEVGFYTLGSSGTIRALLKAKSEK
jgi:RNase P/RNase MRP subunit POP5